MPLQQNIQYQKSHVENSVIQPEQKKVIRTRTKYVSVSFVEASVYILLAITIAMLLILVLSLKSESFEMQAEKTSIENSIYMKQGELSELQTEVTYLASYERIYEKAEALGLKMNNRNIRVVEKHE